MTGFKPLVSAALAASVALSPAGAETPADHAFAERAAAIALDARCDLFTDEMRLAMDSGLSLARNALLRGGWSEAQVDHARQIAAASLEAEPCDGAEAAQVIERVTDGYEGWRALSAMSFVGEHRTWSARRISYPEGWLVVQDVSSSDRARAFFGLARSEDGATRLALALPEDLRPRAARIMIRDRALAPERLTGEMRRLAAPRSAHPLAAQSAPDVVARPVWAADRLRPEAQSDFAVAFGGAAAVLWFPEALTDELAALDPREAVAIDFELGARGAQDTSERLFVEVGDFQAARLFASLDAAGLR